MIFISAVFCRELELPCLDLASGEVGGTQGTPTLACLGKVIILAVEGILAQ